MCYIPTEAHVRISFDHHSRLQRSSPARENPAGRVDYLRDNFPDGEVIVVDDGSSDQTADLARQVFQDSGTCAPPSSVTNRISEKAGPSGSDCSPRAATSRCSPTPIFRHPFRSAKTGRPDRNGHMT
jgi:hypothetical protein